MPENTENRIRLRPNFFRFIAGVVVPTCGRTEDGTYRISGQALLAILKRERPNAFEYFMKNAPDLSVQGQELLLRPEFCEEVV